MELKAKITSQNPITGLSPTGAPVDMVEIRFTFGENSNGVVKVLAKGLTKDQIVKEINDYVERFTF